MGGLSVNPTARDRQLANLKRGGQPAPAGNSYRRAHGAYAAIAAERLEAKVAEVFEALAADAPLRDQDGGLPAADAVPVRLLAEVLCRLDDISGYLVARGLEDDNGKLRPAVEIEDRLRRSALDHAEALGMTPRSRARLGLDVARMSNFDLAQHWASSPVVEIPDDAEHLLEVEEILDDSGALGEEGQPDA